ncbi:MAG: protein translocase subunit SecD, partial [Pseudomonadota bacterium]|nr:protein translocase subunit SecD [Pseudomonadota bacterium]
MLHFAKWKVILVLVISIGGLLLALPNLVPASRLAGLPNWVPHKQINLGLDLQGGAHLLYQMDEKELLADWLKNLRGDVRDALRDEKIGYVGLQSSAGDRSVVVQIRETGDVEKALKRLRELSAPLSSNLFTGVSGRDIDLTSEDGGAIRLKVTEPGLANRISSAIESSIETVRRRIDAFGTTEPTIQRQGRDRIL